MSALPKEWGEMTLKDITEITPVECIIYTERFKNLKNIFVSTHRVRISALSGARSRCKLL